MDKLLITLALFAIVDIALKIIGKIILIIADKIKDIINDDDNREEE